MHLRATSTYKKIANTVQFIVKYSDKFLTNQTIQLDAYEIQQTKNI